MPIGAATGSNPRTRGTTRPTPATEMAFATFQQNARLGEIVIDSPPLNLFSADLLADLRAAVDQAADSDIRALLLRAEGDDFSAGADVSIFIGLDEARAAELETTVLSLIAAIEDLPVPALALIHGQCYAGALEVCLSCDLIWAAECSQIGQIEAVAGSIPYAGGTQRIASRIGAGRAAEIDGPCDVGRLQTQRVGASIPASVA